MAAADGATIPLSVVYRTDLRAVAWVPQACHMYGFGSFGRSLEPICSPLRLPLLDRGLVYVLAHVRGGGEMRRTWYEAARLDTKTVTFTNFIAVGRALVDRRVTTPAMLSIGGESPGGMLIGAVLNIAPRMARAGAVAAVPFVDVLVAIADPSLPLSTKEWREWGNPNTRAGYNAIAPWSPTDNVRRVTTYPPVFLTAALLDPNVGYWDAAKLAARRVRARRRGGGVGRSCCRSTWKPATCPRRTAATCGGGGRPSRRGSSPVTASGSQCVGRVRGRPRARRSWTEAASAAGLNCRLETSSAAPFENVDQV